MQLFLTVLGHCPSVGGQLAVMLLTSAGWGYWVFRCAGGPPLRRPEDLLLCGITGLCACWLVLQNLAYLGVRLAWSAWLAAAIAVVGLVGIWRQVAVRSSRTSKSGGIGLAPAGIVLVVFGFQASGVIFAGRGDYYGYARQDQVNYIQLAQFLIEKPFSTEIKDVGLHPWLEGDRRQTEANWSECGRRLSGCGHQDG